MVNRRVLGACVLAGLLAVASACGDDEDSSGDNAPEINPLTGMEGVPDGPVAVVKIDNTPDGRPQAGINQADVVYLEQVEGGQTRVAAVFATNRPEDVYAVRSARETDVELLAQYGSPILIFSGANSGVLDTINDSDLVPVSEDEMPDLFGHVEGRVRPYQTSVDVATVVDKYPDASGVRDMGFDWDTSSDSDEESGSKGDASPPTDPWSGAAAVNSWQLSMGDVTTGFSWDATSARWVWSMNGRQINDATGTPVSTPNVIVQYCTVTASKYVDTTGSATPFTDTVGSGQATIFRDGKRVDGEWSRPSAGDGTVFRTADGTEIPLTPGGTWVVLAPEGNPITTS